MFKRFLNMFKNGLNMFNNVFLIIYLDLLNKLILFLYIY